MAKNKKTDKKVKTRRKTSKPDKKKTNKKSEFDEYYQEDVEDFEEPEEDGNYEEVEDNREFMKQVKEFEKEHEGSKIVNVYNIIIIDYCYELQEAGLPVRVPPAEEEAECERGQDDADEAATDEDAVP